MSYLVLARKYRPQVFEDVVGQQEIAAKLKNALSSGRTGHAYLFCGPRGVGKTTCARILARELNQLAPVSAQSGFDLGLQTSMDIIEIDGASNNSVDDVRTLRENVQMVSMNGGYKIYIIDEVHMLSTPAFNALLKTLEEPPAHVKFILATTDPNKLPLTVVSRCQRFDFRRIPLELMVHYLKDVCRKENFRAEDDALFAVARASQGSMRDALSVLDQLGSTASGRIDLTEVNALLGYVETERLFAVAGAILKNDCASALRLLDDIGSGGKDLKQFSFDLISFFRDLMVMKVGGQELQDLIDYSATYKKAMFELAAATPLAVILSSIDHFLAVQEIARTTSSPALALEIAFARIAVLPKDKMVPAAPPRPVPPSSSLLQNNRGAVSIEPVMVLPKPQSPAAVAKQVREAASSVEPSGGLSMDHIAHGWNTLTNAVSQRRMSTGTYLLEGAPAAFNGSRLTIAFTPEYSFHKEFLDRAENLKLIAEAFQEVFGVMCSVELVIGQGVGVKPAAPVLDDALAMFGGEVVNEWHSQEDEGDLE